MRRALLAAAGVVLITFWWASDGRVTEIAALMVATVVLVWLFGMESLWPVWRRAGLVVVGALVAVLVASTGGSASAYQDVFLLVVIGAALVCEEPAAFIGGVVVAAVGAATPIVYEDVQAAFVADTVADVLVWTVVGVVTWQIERVRSRKEQERARLLVRYATVAEDERGRLADDLHHEAIQLLSAARLRLESAAPGGEQGDLSPARELLGDGLRSLRRMILELKAPDVTTGSLHDLVQAYADRLLTPLEVDVDLHIAQPEDTDDTVVTAAYRITVEALSNVARHARASTATVTVHEQGELLVGEVTDDGRGIHAPDPPSRPGHIGLRSMHERAELLGGSVHIDPLPPARGSGTVVIFELPRHPVGL